MKDPYKILGLSKSSSQDEIKAAYRTLAKKFHPDLNAGNKDAEIKFKELNTANQLIGNADDRAKFDRGETDEQQQEQARRYYEQQQRGGHSQNFGQGFGDAFNGEDLFEQLFQRSGRGRKTQSNDLPGEDQLYQLEIDFKDAALGGEREISLPSGKHLKVKIPGGIKSGTRLRFKAHGSPGRGRGAAGDAYVEITVRPLEGFKRVEQDIETEVNISFIEALLGGEIKVPTIEGSVMLKIPSGVSTGSRLRIRGKGVSDGKKRGDQIVALKVVMPKKPDPELVEAVQAWEEKFNYNPRTEVV